MQTREGSHETQREKNPPSTVRRVRLPSFNETNNNIICHFFLSSSSLYSYHFKCNIFCFWMVNWIFSLQLIKNNSIATQTNVVLDTWRVSRSHICGSQPDVCFFYLMELSINIFKWPWLPHKSASILMYSSAPNELWLHPAALQFWPCRRLFSIIRFQDLFPRCLWCVTPKSACRETFCGSRPSDIQTAAEEVHDVNRWGKWVSTGNNDDVFLTLKYVIANYFTGERRCGKVAGLCSVCQLNK